MKKAVKIGAVVLGVIIIAALIFFIFFPGLPAYYNIKKNYKYINEVPKEYPYADVKTPESFVEVSVHGLTLSLPPELEKKYPDETEGMKSGLYVSDSEKVKTSVIFMEKNDFDSEGFTLFDALDDGSTEEKISAEIFRKSLEKLEIKVPENYYEFFNLVYTTSLEDFNIHTHGTKGSFIVIAEWKERLIPTFIEIYPFETDNAIGFIQLYGKPNENTNTYKMVVELYNKDNLNECFSAIVGSEDLTTVQQIVNSARLAET